MKRNLFLAGTAALALLLTACEKESGETVVSDDGTKAITVTISGVNLTKASVVDNSGTPGADIWEEGESSTSSFDIYFADAAGKILYAYEPTTTMISAGSIRFIGLEGVSAVYVTANDATTLLSVGSNVSAITADLTTHSAYTTAGAESSQSAILYIGADKSLSLGNEPASSVGTTLSYSAGTFSSADSYTASQYYLADVDIRPIISRLEIAKIQAVASGTYTVGTTEAKTVDGYNYTYTVTWSGFKPALKGIYMSNFYGTINPAEPTVTNGFATPTGDKVLTSSTYLWDESTGIGTNYNKDGISLYTDNGTVFSTTPTDESPNYIYFSSSEKCVPFNFFVPFDVTDEGTEITQDATVMGYEPKYHFIFDTSTLTSASSYTYSLSNVTKYSSDDTSFGSGESVEVTESGNPALFAALTSEFNFVSVDDGSFYANIVGLKGTEDIKTDDGETTIYSYSNDEYLPMQPNKIYKLSEVTVYPYNLSTSTVTEDSYNLVVNVQVITYSAESVTAVFK